MANFLRSRSLSLSTVLLVLLVIVALQGGISYTLTFGRLDSLLFGRGNPISVSWFAVRIILLGAIVALWFMNRKRELFRCIIVVNGVLTVGLLINMLALLAILSGFASQDIKTLLTDVVLMAVSNVLIFSTWYWVIDPPGVEDIQR